jgi:hypothetical protein
MSKRELPESLSGCKKRRPNKYRVFRYKVAEIKSQLNYIEDNAGYAAKQLASGDPKAGDDFYKEARSWLLVAKKDIEKLLREVPTKADPEFPGESDEPPKKNKKRRC